MPKLGKLKLAREGGVIREARHASQVGILHQNGERCCVRSLVLCLRIAVQVELSVEVCWPRG